MVTQVFTFGFGQENEGCYVIIGGKTKAECRRKMFESYGDKWAFQYDTKKEAGVEKYNLKKI